MSGAKEHPYTAQHDKASEDDRGGHTALPDNAKEVSFSKKSDIFKNILCFRLTTT